MDEPGHFVAAWMETHLHDFRNNPEDPPLWKYWAVLGTHGDDLPLLRNNKIWGMMFNTTFAAGYYPRYTLYRSHADVDGLLKAARARMSLLGVFLAMLICWWAWRLSGVVAAVAATMAFCLDPNFLAHSPIVKNDVPMTLGFTALDGDGLVGG